ncbi:MAG TPA: SpoIIE family protein phosphatase [Thermoanaerobaculia bacterium]|jgi:serine phosphatase RsbU (regulator of sigma subunit)|nr:SpoIIE family protein phosphatase [Thermoanaerobaculia bacterium]
MKLRTQLVLAFLLLAILPLTGIVLYSYYSSLRAVRQASETEARTLAGEMDARMASIRGELGRGVERMGGVSARDLMTAAQSGQGKADPLLGQMVRGFGEAAPFIQSFEFVPSPPAPNAPQPMDRMVIDIPQALREARREVESSPEKDPLALQAIDQAIRSFGATPPRAPGPPPDPNPDAEALKQEIRKRVEERLAAAQERRAQAQAEAAKRAAADRAVLGHELEVPVREGGEVVGMIKTRVRGDELLWRVLARTRAGEGEVPFALDAQGKLHTVNAADRAKIQKLPLALSVHQHAGAVRWVLGDWVVATKKDAESGVVFGIARPVPLAEVRQTAARNFGYGLGMIGLALLGILPLSSGVTRNLKLVTDGAERIAQGDLDTRVPVRSGNELGKLALTFNQMAADLKTHQERLLEQERLRQQGEIEQTLLRTEYDRKSAELEEARRFQLSLLPKNLPEHPGFEIAVSMRTATEVGGDYYDFHLGEDGALTAAIGDATGHGARAGTMVTAVKSLFSAFAGQREPRELLDEAARAVRRMELGRMAMGLAVARLRDGDLVLSSAGMPPVLLYRGASGGVEEIALPGMPLGGFAFDFEERRLEVTAGDAVLMMTDGLPELANAGGDPLGYPKVRALFEELGGRSPREILAGLNRAAEEWTGGEPPKDDITLVAIRVD